MVSPDPAIFVTGCIITALVLCLFIAPGGR